MNFTPTSIEGVWLLEPKLVTDFRGTFRRHFDPRAMEKQGLVNAVLQSYISENPEAGTLRGFHYQDYPNWEVKTMSCMSGAIYNVIVDLRPTSATFLKWISHELSAANRLSVYVPEGCATAWLTLEPQTWIHYFMSRGYHPESARGFRYNDPLIGVKWPKQPTKISEKDLSFPNLDISTLKRSGGI